MPISYIKDKRRLSKYLIYLLQCQSHFGCEEASDGIIVPVSGEEQNERTN